MKSATMKDVARHAGVSVATVSRVLNNKGGVSSELRQQVLAAARQLQYRPNRSARSLRTKSAKTIALVVPDIQNPFFVDLARALEEVTFGKDYSLLLCNTDDDLDREHAYFELLAEESLAGVVLCATDEQGSTPHVREALDQGIKVVCVDRRLEDIMVDVVLSDNFGGARAAVAHLIEQGHRRIGLIAGPSKYAPGRERQAGYEHALRQYGLPLAPELIKLTNFKSPEAEAATLELLALPDPPTALFLTSGNVAIGSLRAVNHCGLTIPDDISLIVFDDLNWATAYSPPISSVAQKTRALGCLAGNLLLERIMGNDEPPQERRLPTELIIRDSTHSPATVSQHPSLVEEGTDI